MVAPGDEIHLKMRYDSSVYDRQFIENIKGHLTHIVSQILDKPDITPDKLVIITPEEKSSCLLRFLKKLKCLSMTRFMRCLNGIAQTPDQIAIRYEGGSVTYKELNESANKLLCCKTRIKAGGAGRRHALFPSLAASSRYFKSGRRLCPDRSRQSKGAYPICY